MLDILVGLGTVLTSLILLKYLFFFIGFAVTSVKEAKIKAEINQILRRRRNDKNNNIA